MEDRFVFSTKALYSLRKIFGLRDYSLEFLYPADSVILDH